MLGDIAFVRVLGPIQVVTISGLALDLPSASQRRLLARLAVDAPRALRVDLLCDVLAVSPGALRTIVSRLRKSFGDTIVVASQGRYRLAAPVDAALFISSLSQAAAGDDRIGTLERALALCPVDHGTGSRSQIRIEATSTVAWYMKSRLS